MNKRFQNVKNYLIEAISVKLNRHENGIKNELSIMHEPRTNWNEDLGQNVLQNQVNNGAVDFNALQNNANVIQGD